MGSRKASVLPVPVWAVATTSEPVIAGGMDWACTGVGCTNRLRARFWCRQGLSVSSVKVFIKDNVPKTGLTSFMQQAFGFTLVNLNLGLRTEPGRSAKRGSKLHEGKGRMGQETFVG